MFEGEKYFAKNFVCLHLGEEVCEEIKVKRDLFKEASVEHFTVERFATFIVRRESEMKLKLKHFISALGNCFTAGLSTTSRSDASLNFFDSSIFHCAAFRLYSDRPLTATREELRIAEAITDNRKRRFREVFASIISRFN